MNTIINHLLTGKKQLSDVSVATLEEIVLEQPYFSVAHLLLAKKMKAGKHPGFMQQAQKTALFFPNVLWYQLMIQEEESTVAAAPLPQEVHEIEATAPVVVELPVEPVATQPQQYIEEDTAFSEDASKALTEEDDQKVTDRLAAAMQDQLAILNRPVEQNTELPIEADPFHTVDYFASLGIKLEEIAADNDEFVNKVKKFTDWLKQMKKVNTADLVADDAIEKAIQHIAANSNVEKEVVTETMAQAFVQQGKISRAIQIYSKLSFLNPAKSAYFATKILELKDYKQ